jgi:hypothetical protein
MLYERKELQGLVTPAERLDQSVISVVRHIASKTEGEVKDVATALAEELEAMQPKGNQTAQTGTSAASTGSEGSSAPVGGTPIA